MLENESSNFQIHTRIIPTPIENTPRKQKMPGKEMRCEYAIAEATSETASINWSKTQRRRNLRRHLLTGYLCRQTVTQHPISSVS